MDEFHNFTDLHDAPGRAEGVPADGAELRVLPAPLAVVRLAQVLQVLQLPELLPEQSCCKIIIFVHKTKINF